MVASGAILATAGYLTALIAGVVPYGWADTQVFWLGFTACCAVSVFSSAAAN